MSHVEVNVRVKGVKIGKLWIDRKYIGWITPHKRETKPIQKPWDEFVAWITK